MAATREAVPFVVLEYSIRGISLSNPIEALTFFRLLILPIA